MRRPRHRPPPWWVRHRLPVSIAAGALTVALVVAVAAAIGPRPHVAHQPLTAAPTSEHASGTKPWPTVAIPTIGAPGAWDPTSTSSTPTAARTAPPTCSRCGDRSTPAPTTPRASSTVAPPAAAAQPAPGANPQPVVAVELLALVNRDRATAGCKPVTPNGSLNQQSQTSADDQAATDSMHHSAGPTGFASWGENVAYGYDTAAAVHQAFMSSPPHRANVLNCDFTLIGYGFADSAGGTRYWTEQFAA